MKYPLDEATLNESLGHIIAHERAQRLTIQLITGLLIEAMATDEIDGEEEWYKEADKFLQLQQQLKMDHENRIFDEDNLRKARNMLPKDRTPSIHHSVARATSPVNAPVLSGTGSGLFDAMRDQNLNKHENSFGEELSERDLAAHFSESPAKSKKKKEKKTKLENMTLDEINEWEAKQNNSNDLYKIKARVANIARGSGASLTEHGEALCNTFVHVLKALYDFAEQIEDKSTRIKLIETIRKQEGMPGNLIEATKAGVK